MTNNSPLPWSVKSDICHFDTLSDITDANGEKIAQTIARGLVIELDAKLIVEAVNSHAQQKERIEELEKALTQIAEYCNPSDFPTGEAIPLTGMIVTARAALSKGGE